MSFQLSLFTEKDRGRFNFRCPYCGDSKKDPSAARGNIKPLPNDQSVLIYKCFNCGKGPIRFETFLRDHGGNLYDEYKREKFDLATHHDPSRLFNADPEPDSAQYDEVVHPSGLRPEKIWKRCSDCLDDPDLLATVESRCLTNHLDGLFWTTRFRQDIHNHIDELKFESVSFASQCDKRIIIPIFDPTGERMIAVQGRAVFKDCKPKYFTIYFDRRSPLLFGLERMDPRSNTLIFEGALDSLFIDNAVSTCSAQHSPGVDKYIPHRIWYLDQEPRNTQIVEKILDLVDSGERVVIMKDPRFIEKDVNELVIGGHTPESIKEAALANTFSGLRARAQIAWWRKDR